MVSFFILQPALPAFAAETNATDTVDSTPSIDASDETVTSDSEAEDTSPKAVDDTATVTEEAASASESDVETPAPAEETQTTPDADSESDPATSTKPDQVEVDEGFNTTDTDGATEPASVGATPETDASTTPTTTSSTPVEDTQEPLETATTSTETPATDDVVEDVESATTTATGTPASDTDPNQADAGSATNDDLHQEEATTTATTTASTSEEPLSASTSEEPLTDISDEPNVPSVTTAEPTAATDDEDTVSPATTPTEPVEFTNEATTTVASDEIPQSIEASVTNDQNRMTFGVNDCVAVEDGSYYCMERSTEAATQIDGVTAERDADGDYEIYFTVGGETTQITNNDWEDKAPHYDPRSEVIVFHRLLSGRYQIIRYDIATGREEQLTKEAVNHMEPVQTGDITAWQQWDGADWEIAAIIAGERIQLSDNNYHDVAPQVQNGLIIWHTTGGPDDKQLSVYDTTTGITSLIADPEGGQVNNPRFVLVYDTVFANGDKLTKTYDPATGEVTPVGKEPAPLPALPDPEPTPEATALIQNKSPNRDEFDGVDDEPVPNTAEDNGHTSSSTLVATSTAAELTDSTIDMAEASSTADTLPLTDYDLIVEPTSSSSAQTGDSATTTDNVE